MTDHDGWDHTADQAPDAHPLHHPEQQPEHPGHHPFDEHPAGEHDGGEHASAEHGLAEHGHAAAGGIRADVSGSDGPHPGLTGTALAGDPRTSALLAHLFPDADHAGNADVSTALWRDGGADVGVAAGELWRLAHPGSAVPLGASARSGDPRDLLRALSDDPADPLLADVAASMLGELS